MKEIINHIGDIYAVPFFMLGTFYFYTIKNKNNIENLLLLFNIAGILIDGTFTYLFLQDSTFTKIHSLASNIIIFIAFLAIIFIYDNSF